MGFAYLNNLGSPGPHETNKEIKSHDFFYVCTSRKNQKKYNRLGDLGGYKKKKNENSKLWQATEPIDNHGGNMYALASCNGV